jgi:FkbM family methyltransferase
MTPRGFFVEIGAANFDTLMPLVKNGWNGIIVEPVPGLAASLRDAAKGLPVEIIEAAVSDLNGEVEMMIASGDDWVRGISHVVSNNHLGARLSDNPDNTRHFSDRITVKAMTLDTLLRETNSAIDFMKIDAEGHELNILQNYSWRIKPKTIKVEHKHVDDEALVRLLEAQDYMVWREVDDLYAVC